MKKQKYIMRPTGRVDVVIDTDAYNEIDDQFAIAYMLCSPDRINLKALYAAPFHNKNSSSPQDGMERSYQELLNLLKLAGKMEMASRVFRGATTYLPKEDTPVNSDAVMDLIAQAKHHSQDNPLYVLAIGAITNVASALLLAPEIAQNIVIVWLGGHAYHYVHNNEFNCKQDVAAVRVVFGSDAPIVQLPCRGVVDVLAVTQPELDFWLSGKNSLCDYLVEHTVEEANTYAQGKPWSRVIWDVSAVAWLMDTQKHAVLDRCEIRPIAQYDHHYSFPPIGEPLNYVYQINRDLVFEDMFTRLASGPACTIGI